MATNADYADFVAEKASLGSLADPKQLAPYWGLYSRGHARGYAQGATAGGDTAWTAALAAASAYVLAHDGDSVAQLSTGILALTP